MKEWTMPYFKVIPYLPALLLLWVSSIRFPSCSSEALEESRRNQLLIDSVFMSIQLSLHS